MKFPPIHEDVAKQLHKGNEYTGLGRYVGEGEAIFMDCDNMYRARYLIFQQNGKRIRLATDTVAEKMGIQV